MRRESKHPQSPDFMDFFQKGADKVSVEPVTNDLNTDHETPKAMW